MQQFKAAILGDFFRDQESFPCHSVDGFMGLDLPEASILVSRVSETTDEEPLQRVALQFAAIWLLLYSRPNVSCSVAVPHGIERWRFPFEFDRVLWFVILRSEVVEIQRAEKLPTCISCQ